MNVPEVFAPEIERELEILQARIEEQLGQIRRDREEGERIMEQTRVLAQNNARELEELGRIIARLK